jgi:hypothetical protein
MEDYVSDNIVKRGFKMERYWAIVKIFDNLLFLDYNVHNGSIAATRIKSNVDIT